MSQTANNTVRISAGEWRSRLLRFPDVAGLRPTPERVRQTLFNWLGQDMHGLSCLDLFAGTGVLGFESLSRGAKRAVMLDNQRAAYQALLSNQANLKAQLAEILQQDAMQYLAHNTSQFDVIFVDPPYHQGWLDQVIPLLSRHLAADGRVYIESEYALTECHPFQLIKSGRAGHVYYHLLKQR